MVRSRRSLTTAHQVIAQDPDSACNRAYYEIFYAARAALLEVEQAEAAMGKTHAGMIAAFGEHLVKPGRIAGDHGRAFAQVERERLIADYSGDGTSPDAAQLALGRAQAFVHAVEGFMATRAG